MIAILEYSNIFIIDFYLFIMDICVIAKLNNQKDFMYFKIKADASVIYALDEMTSALDEYEEGLVYPTKNIDYDKFIPHRTSFNVGDGDIYAIVIYNKDLIDLILFKNNSEFDRFVSMMNDRFVYSNGESF